MLKVLYILEALKHNYMTGLRLDEPEGYRTTASFFFLRVEMLNVLYILEALRHNNITPGLLPG